MTALRTVLAALLVGSCAQGADLDSGEVDTGGTAGTTGTGGSTGGAAGAAGANGGASGTGGATGGAGGATGGAGGASGGAGGATGGTGGATGGTGGATGGAGGATGGTGGATGGAGGATGGAGGATGGTGGATGGAGGATGGAGGATGGTGGATGGAGGATGGAGGATGGAGGATGGAGGGGGCAGAVADWSWNAGTAPTGSQIATSGVWSVGVASAGPSDGQTWLATNPGGKYPGLANDWVQLPTLDLSAVASCALRVTVELWRESEKVGLVYYDGGNLQYSTEVSPGPGSSWSAMSGSQMNYDGEILGSCGGIACLVQDQDSWAGTSSPKAKTASYDFAVAPARITLRFTFFSDDLGDFAGLYIKRVLLEAH